MPPTRPKTTATAGSTRKSTVRAVAIGLGLIAVAAVVIFFGARLSRQENDRRASERRSSDLASIKEGGADEIMIYDAELLAMIVADPEAAEKATSLIFSSVDFSDKRFAEIKKLPVLRNVGVYSCEHTGALLNYIQAMETIERMWIETSPVQDEGITLLATLPNLKQIRFEQVMSAKQIELLGKTLPGVNVDIPFPETGEPR